MKPPELKYGWRIGEKEFMTLVRTHLPDAIQYSLGPEPDDDGNDPDVPAEEFRRLYPDTHATLFDLPLVDSILKYWGVAITGANRALIDVDYLRDSRGRADVGLAVGSTYTSKMLLEPHNLKLNALVSPNEDAKWYFRIYTFIRY